MFDNEKKEIYHYKLRMKKKLYFNVDTMWGVFSFEFANREDLAKSGVDVHPIYGNFVISGDATELREGEVRDVIFTDHMDDKYGKGYQFIEIISEGLKTPEAQAEFLRQMINSNKHYKEIVETYPPTETYIEDLIAGKYDLKVIKGIQEATEQRYLESLSEHREYQEAIIKLAPIGAGITTIKKLVKHFKGGENVVKILETDIYRVTEVDSFGFRRVDELALKLGYDMESTERLVAGAAYVLEQMSENGDVKIPIEDFDAEMCKILELSEVTDELFNSIMEDHRFTYSDGIICLEKLRLEEFYLAKKIVELATNVRHLEGLEENKEAIIDKNESENGFKFNEQQRGLIDSALKQGVTILTGYAGTGKCVRGDTLVSTDEGFIKIEEIPQYYDVNPQTDESIAKIISYDTSGKKYINKETSHWFNMGHSKTVHVTTSYGRILEGTPEHPLLTVNDETGDLEYKKLRDMGTQDTIVLSRGDMNFGKNTLVSEEMAWALGVLVGDGYLAGELQASKPSWDVTLTNSNPDIYIPFNDIIEKEFNTKFREKTKDKNTWTHYINHKENYITLRDKYKMSMETGRNKEIPSTVLQAPKEVVVKFLQGLFDTDGSMVRRVSKKGEEFFYFEYSTASEQLMQQLLTLLLNFGVVGHGRVKQVKDSDGKYRDYHILEIADKNGLMSLNEEIGFLNHKEKKMKLEKTLVYFEDKASNTNKELAFGLKNKLRDVHNFMRDNHGWGRYTEFKSLQDTRIGANGREKQVSFNAIREFTNKHKDKDYPHKQFLENVVNNLHFETVQSIKESENIVYDFTVPGTHSFVANGIVNHNTSSVKTIVEIYRAAGYEPIAMALSGKAAQVMTENGIENAGTIHRQLVYKDGYFTFNHFKKLPNQLIVVDEASMINNSLFKNIVDAIEVGHRLLIIGDNAQLPPIGHGAVFDTLLSVDLPNSKLTEIHRQAAKSGIITVATDVRNGEQINEYGSKETQIVGELKDMRVFNYIDKTLIFRDITTTIKQYLKNPAMNPRDLQVITAMKRGGLGVPTLNKELQDIINPHPRSKQLDFHLIKGQELRVGDRVIQNGNLYKADGFYTLDSYKNGNRHDTDVFNGTIGYVEKYEEHGLLVRFDGYTGTEYVFYAKEGEQGKKPIGMLDLAYAITTHRSQGSGFKTVIFTFDYSAYMLLSKEFVYTGITRAIDNCLMFVENTALHHAIKNSHSNNRLTFLREFLEAELENSGVVA